MINSLSKTKNIDNQDNALTMMKEIEANILSENLNANNENNTYYISTSGTSTDGTDINNPMSLNEANKKTFYGNEKVLFKCGDIFYGQINFNVQAEDGTMLYIGSYGEGEKPIISGANILINNYAWEFENGLYKLDLSNYNNFLGIGKTYWEPYNIGFMEDENGNIYGSRKNAKEKLENEFDYYCENNYIYVKSNINPSEKLGKIKFVSRNNLVSLSTNTIFEGINVQDTGAHGIVKKNSEIKNVYIKDCVIQNIGGSIQKKESFTRYGNGIEFWSGAENIIVKNNLIKNVYDAAITLQGDNNEFKDVSIEDNILLYNCYSFELWACFSSMGMNNVSINRNITINQGKGWGQKVRPNPYNSAEYVFYNYSDSSKMNIKIYNNYCLNSTRFYYIYYAIKNRLKKEIKIENNQFNFYNKDDDIYIVNDIKKDDIKNYLNTEYNIDQNSTFRTISDNEEKQISNPEILNSNDYNKIKDYYQNLEKEFKYTDIKESIINKYKEYENNNSKSIEKIENLSNQLTAIQNSLSETTNSNSTEEGLNNLVNSNINVINYIKDSYQNKKIEEAEATNLFGGLADIIKSYLDIYEFKQYTSEIDTVTSESKINELESILIENEDINLELPKSIKDIAKKLIEDDVNTYLENTLLETLITISNEIINSKIDNYISQNPTTITYSETNLTNKNIEVTLNTQNDTQVTNNSNNNKYIFKENGTFTFEITRRDRKYQITTEVKNIDKTPPKIEGVENKKIYQQTSITPTITDENLQEVKLTIDGELKEYKEKMTFTQEGTYSINATDKAGNETIMTFTIIEPEADNNYKLQDNYIKNIQSSTNLNDFTKKLNANIKYKIYKNKDDNKEEVKQDEIIATGDTLEIENGTTYNLIVKGDCNKDGLTNIVDLVRLRKQRLLNLILFMLNIYGY